MPARLRTSTLAGMGCELHKRNSIQASRSFQTLRALSRAAGRAGPPGPTLATNGPNEPTLVFQRAQACSQRVPESLPWFPTGPPWLPAALPLREESGLLEFDFKPKFGRLTRRIC